jgi:hypothetical protein
MTDSDDKLRRAYRQLASEEPSALIDAAILAQARARRPRFARWAGPVSIAAVLVLGIGVSLRMQLEQPGVETAAPGGSPEYPLPQSAVPEAPPAEPARPPAADANIRALPDAKIKVAPAKPAPRPEMAAPAPEKKEGFRLDRAPASAMAPAPPPAVSPPPAATVPAPAAAPAFVPEPPRAAEKERARAPAPAELGAAAAPQSRASASQAPAAPAAREEAMRDSAGALQKKSLNAMEADADPARELERIAKLREAGRHAEADKALEEFRKRHPDFRIPEAMWERVRPR